MQSKELTLKSKFYTNRLARRYFQDLNLVYEITLEKVIVFRFIHTQIDMKIIILIFYEDFSC